MTHYRRQARRAQSRGGMRSRSPSMFWKAHDDSISMLSAVEHPPSIISCSHDCLTKVWSIEGKLLAVIDSNNPKPSLSSKGPAWAFTPAADKGQKSHRNRKDENFSELVDAVHLEDKGIEKAHALQHSGKVLKRHPSQENFLNRQLHHGKRPTTTGETMDDAFKSGKKKFGAKWTVNRRTSWNPSDAKRILREEEQMSKAYQGGGVGGDRQWDGMMDSLHIFESALDEHTKTRSSNGLDKQLKNFKKRQEIQPWPEFPFKRWGVREDLPLERKTVHRPVPVGRPTTSLSKGARRGAGGGGGMTRPGTAPVGGEQTVNICMKLKHMNFM